LFVCLFVCCKWLIFKTKCASVQWNILAVIFRRVHKKRLLA
jgi:hypothetical protein